MEQSAHWMFNFSESKRKEGLEGTWHPLKCQVTTRRVILK